LSPVTVRYPVAERAHTPTAGRGYVLRSLQRSCTEPSVADVSPHGSSGSVHCREAAPSLAWQMYRLTAPQVLCIAEKLYRAWRGRCIASRLLRFCAMQRSCTEPGVAGTSPHGSSGSVRALRVMYRCSVGGVHCFPWPFHYLCIGANVASGCGPGRQRSRSSNPDRVKNSSLLVVQSGSGAHPASCLMGNGWGGGLCHGVKLTTDGPVPL
jgi:hypothetical protein